ncbi:hypothetical protein [Prosthecobacter fluviatilis]|uniref:Uncharacterized protein n=1 Tax=Prosthecobacter fluviatilis TaxID=445931 RepID=A0ABW0KTN9_9BACT
MKPLPRKNMHRMLLLITAANALTHCSSSGTYLSKPMSMSDLRTINPRGYLDALTPNDRETTAMEMGRLEMQSRKIERDKFHR